MAIQNSNLVHGQHALLHAVDLLVELVQRDDPLLTVQQLGHGVTERIRQLAESRTRGRGAASGCRGRILAKGRARPSSLSHHQEEVDDGRTMVLVQPSLVHPSISVVPGPVIASWHLAN